MKLIPIITHWGLFTGPQISFIVAPGEGKPVPGDEVASMRAAAARQDAAYREIMRNGGPKFSGLSAPARCSCHRAYGQP